MFDFDDLEEMVAPCTQPAKRLCGKEQSGHRQGQKAFIDALSAAQQEDESPVSPKRKSAHKAENAMEHAIDRKAGAPQALPGMAKPPTVARPLPRPVRVLCLHGASSNATVMRFQLAALKGILGREAHFEFLEGESGPSPTDHDPTMSIVAGDMPLRSWFKVKYAGFPHTHENLLGYSGTDDVFSMLDEHIRKNGPYDVLMGFSQGCDLVAMLSSEYEGTPLAPKLNVLWCPDHQNLWKSSAWYSENCVDLRVPTMTVLGQSDVHYRAGLESTAVWHQPKIFEHGGAHKVPQENRKIMNAVAQEMRSCLLAHH